MVLGVDWSVVGIYVVGSACKCGGSSRWGKSRDLESSCTSYLIISALDGGATIAIKLR